MSNFDLPIITSDAKPDFADVKSCAAWLRTVPLINVGPSHSRLLGQLEELNCFELPPEERLAIVELLTEPVAFVQIEHAKKFAARAVPLAKPEREIFHNVVALWDSLLHGYLRCLNAISDGRSWPSEKAALVCQRAMWCVTERMSEYHKCYQMVNPEDWALLHGVFAIAETRGVLDNEVVDPTHRSQTSTCLRTYAQALLMHLASDPSEQTPKQMGTVRRWLERWTTKVRIGRALPSSELGVVALAVDLASARGPTHEALTGDSVRFLDLEEVSKSIRARVGQLRKGETPQAIGLGEDISAAAAEQLLVVVHRHWCEERKARASARRAVTSSALLCTGLPAIHYYIGGSPFRQPGDAKQLTKEQREEIATFGRVATRQDDEHSLIHGFVQESWTIREESLGGLRIERSEEGGRGRFAQQQLVAVRPADARSYMLGVLRWLQVSENFDIHCGVRVLPGVPQCVAVRATGLNAMSEKYIQALLLPAVPALQSPATLILPAGWFRPKRVVDVYTDKSEQILLTGLVDRGSDFERVSIGVP